MIARAVSAPVNREDYTVYPAWPLVMTALIKQSYGTRLMDVVFSSFGQIFSSQSPGSSWNGLLKSINKLAMIITSISYGA